MKRTDINQNPNKCTYFLRSAAEVVNNPVEQPQSKKQRILESEVNVDSPLTNVNPSVTHIKEIQSESQNILTNLKCPDVDMQNSNAKTFHLSDYAANLSEDFFKKKYLTRKSLDCFTEQMQSLLLQRIKENVLKTKSLTVKPSAKIHIQSVKVIKPPETNFKTSKKRLTLAYAAYLSVGLKRRILFAVLDMSFDEFQKYTRIHSGAEFNENEHTLQLYNSAIAVEKLWHPRLYMSLLDLQEYLTTKGIRISDIDFKHISPIILNHEEISSITNFDDIVRLDYFKETAKRLTDEESLLNERRIHFYNKCKSHNQWIWKTPVLESNWKTILQNNAAEYMPKLIVSPRGSVENHKSNINHSEDLINPKPGMSKSAKSTQRSPTKKSEPKIIRIDSSEEIDEQHASDDADDYDNEMSIYVKHTQKTPKYQRHVWHNEPAQSEDEEGSNHFVHPECDLNQTQQCIENICSDGNVNPFNTDLINAFLEKVDFVNYIKQLPECELVGRVKQLRKDSIVKVNDTQFKVLKLARKGSYGAIFCATECKTGKKYALKQEGPANYWEYYICLELRSRLHVDELAAAYMIVDYALVGNNVSILISQFSTYGSLLAVCNKIKEATMKNVDEYVVMHLTCQLLEIIDHLHAAGIIHADIKADNFLLMEKLSYDRNHISLMLINFGVSIDTSFFKNGQNFTFVYKDNAMKCIEMRENRPWTYQLDLYGLAGVIHVLLFGKYMDVEKNANGFWMHKTHVPRYLKKLLWEKVFKTLLNVRDCAYTSMPNLQNLRTLLKEEIAENEKGVIKKIFDFNRALES